ncbi:hypothetical protein JAB6_18350 [Janthinobacterium sp. HH104]|nr:hypothetical protein JAB6_18350 [Janthinobacterium sp. HH104]
MPFDSSSLTPSPAAQLPVCCGTVRITYTGPSAARSA